MTHAQPLVIVGMAICIILNTLKGGMTSAILNGIMLAVVVGVLTHA